MAKAKRAKTKKASRPKKGKRKAAKTIGILHSGTAGKHDKEMKAFMKGLGTQGYTSSNLTIVGPLYSDDDPALLDSNAGTLARDASLNLIIAAGGTRSVYAMQNAQTAARTSTDVVFTTFSQSSAPAPNMTGVNAMTSALDIARLQTLHTIAPNETTFGVLENQTRRDHADNRSKQDAWADGAGVSLDRHSVFKNANEADQKVVDRINAAFNDWRTKSINFAAVCADPIFNDFRKELIDAAKGKGAPGGYHIRTIYQWKEFKDDGAAPDDVTLGTVLVEAYETAGEIAGKVLDLADPSDIAKIPVVTLNKIETSREGTAQSKRKRRR